MRRGSGRVVVAGAAVVATLALTGCTGQAEDPPTTTPATSAAPSPSATPTDTPTPDAATPPERPDMSQVDAATAEAVARYFLELYPYVYATGDLTEWRALSHPECIFCASVITNVEEMVAAGKSADGGEVTAAITAAELSPGTFAIGGSVDQASGIEYDPAGVVIGESTGGSHEVAMNLVSTPTGWLVRAVEFREAPQ